MTTKQQRRPKAVRTKAAATRLLARAADKAWRYGLGSETRAKLIDEIRWLVEFIGYWRTSLKTEDMANEMMFDLEKRYGSIPVWAASATGLPSYASGAAFDVRLGWANGGPASNACAVDVTGHVPGTYTGVITLTVAVL